MSKYHIIKDGQNSGQYSIEEIQTEIRNGTLKPDDLAWTEGMTDWQSIQTLSPVTHLFPPVANIPVTAKSAINETVGTIALVLPLGGAALMWFWVGSMNLLQNPSSSLNSVAVLVVFGTAILIGVEANELGMAGPNDSRPRATSPLVWGITTLLLWFISFPLYMFTRSKYGVKNRCIEAMLITFLFCLSYFVIGGEIGSEKNKVREALSKFHTSYNSDTLNKSDTLEELQKNQKEIMQRLQKNTTQVSLDTSRNNQSSEKVETISVKHKPIEKKSLKVAKDMPTSEIGENVTFSDSEWKVLEVVSGKAWISFNQFIKSRETTGKYVQIKYDVTNTANEDEQILENPKLVDSKGRKYRPMSDSASYLPSGAKEITLEQLPPGVLKTFYALYEVPDDSSEFFFEARSLGFNPDHSLVRIGYQ